MHRSDFERMIFEHGDLIGVPITPNMLFTFRPRVKSSNWAVLSLDIVLPLAVVFCTRSSYLSLSRELPAHICELHLRCLHPDRSREECLDHESQCVDGIADNTRLQVRQSVLKCKRNCIVEDEGKKNVKLSFQYLRLEMDILNTARCGRKFFHKRLHVSEPPLDLLRGTNSYHKTALRP